MGFNYERLNEMLRRAIKEFKQTFGTFPTDEKLGRVIESLEQDEYDYDNWKISDKCVPFKVYEPEFNGNEALKRVFEASCLCNFQQWQKINSLRLSFMTEEQVWESQTRYMHEQWLDIARLIKRDCTICAWNRTKKIYSFDGDFLEALINTDNVFVPPDTFSHLPFSDMYLDFSANSEVCEKYGCEGAFVTAVKMAGTDIPTHKEYWWEILVAGNPSGAGQITIVEDNKIDGCDIFSLVVQCLIYLSSTDPDVRDRQRTTKSTSPNKTTVKLENTANETEVGFRYGEAFRAHMQKVGNSEQAVQRQTNGTRKAPKPHIVRAHYNYYWCGKGRTELRARWLSPYYVGVKDAPDDLDVVAHNIS